MDLVFMSAGALAVIVSLAAVRHRARPDSITEHQRAIETLREIAEHPSEAPRPEQPDRRYATDHIRFVAEAPEKRRPRRKPRRTAAHRRQTRTDSESRPTVATLPTTQPPRLRAVPDD